MTAYHNAPYASVHIQEHYWAPLPRRVQMMVRAVSLDEDVKVLARLDLEVPRGAADGEAILL